MSAPKLGIIVFARMSSQRLPRKVLMEFGGRPLLAHILARAAAVSQPVIVATSDREEDDAIADMARACGAAAFRGALDDVLQRAVDCADAYSLDAFARLCGDRPYFPQDQMREALALMGRSMAGGEAVDLVTNHVPENPPAGLSTEVVRVAALRRALAGGATARQREHLTAWLYDHAGGVDIRPVPANFDRVGGTRFAVDTREDYDALGQVARQLGDVHAGHEAVARLLGLAGVVEE